MESLWRKETGKIKAREDQGKEKYDVIVIGAGMTGILTAYYLQEAGKRVLVLEGWAFAIRHVFNPWNS